MEYATHYPLTLGATHTHGAVKGTWRQETKRQLIFLLDQTMKPAENTATGVKYDTYHMEDIGIDFLQKKWQNLAIEGVIFIENIDESLELTGFTFLFGISFGVGNESAACIEDSMAIFFGHV